MNQTTIHALYILIGVVFAIVAFGAVTSIIEAAMGPWGKLAGRFPNQPVRNDQNPASGEAMLAFTKRPYALTDDQRARGFLSGSGCLLSIIAAVGVAAFVAAMVMFFNGTVPPVSVWGLAMGASVGGWTVMVLIFGVRFFRLKAFHKPVKFAADDEHLHLQREGSGGFGATRVSIPWAEINDIGFDAMTDAGDDLQPWARFTIADEHHAHGWRSLVEREMLLRNIPLSTPIPRPGTDTTSADPGPPFTPPPPADNDWSANPNDNWGDTSGTRK